MPNDMTCKYEELYRNLQQPYSYIAKHHGYHTMKKFCLLILLAVCTSLYGQFTEQFTDGDYTNDPQWVGQYENFAINPWKQLQTKANGAATSYLSTRCKVNSQAEWSFWCRIACEPSSYNYIRIYIASTTENPAQGDGLYVQAGGADKNIALYQQHGDVRRLLIVNNERKQILSNEDNKVQVKVSIDEKGEICLYSKVIGTDTDYTLEGKCFLGKIGRTEWFSILVRNTKQTGDCYYADDIIAEGEIDDSTETETADGDLVINEIMFDPSEGGQEYIEIYNKDSLAADLSQIGLTTKNQDGEFLAPNKFPSFSSIEANDYAVLCKDADSLIHFHQIEYTDNILSCNWSRKLSNNGTTIYLIRATERKDSVIVLDSVSYSPKWHHPLLDETKGVSLERINPNLPSNEPTSWHSASKDRGYATPGEQNSQYRDISNIGNTDTKQYVWLEQESFSPNGDGIEDVCLIHYLLPTEGYTITLRIFTPRGVLVTYPYKNSIASTEGVLIWDGTLTNNHVGEVGIYVIQCEFINPSTGKTIRERFPVVIADR